MKLGTVKWLLLFLSCTLLSGRFTNRRYNCNAQIREITDVDIIISRDHEEVVVDCVRISQVWMQISNLILFVDSMKEVWVELRAPRFVVYGHNAVFRCEHNVEPQTLYKVVFFKSGKRIMQYIRGRDPPFERYNFTGADIDKMTPNSITLEKMGFTASGPYACEIALEMPLYSKVSKIHKVNVIVRQKYRPKIKIKHKNLSSNDVLEATCQSGPAHPAPHVIWFINNVEVNEKFIFPQGTVNAHRHHHGMTLSLTNSSLRFPLINLQLNANQTVHITCLSTIPSYASIGEGFADIQNHTVTVNVIHMGPAAVPTQQLGQIVTAEQSRSSLIVGDYNVCILFIMNIFVLLSSEYYEKSLIY